MDKLSEYRNHIQSVLEWHGNFKPKNPGVERQVIVDREHDHYLLVNVGWEDQSPVYHTFIHVDIKDGKIWIQRDFVEPGVANELMELGVPKEDIVLAFHAPYKRPYTGFAVA